jgi:NAD(P)-dependent dehydrogenase (short-subunit alcohol dehydrogenase family)
MPTAVVTGANRGIGLEFVHQLTKAGWEVYALCRQSSKELEGLQPKKIFTADVRHVQEIQNIFASIDEPIDLLINNAGVSDGRWSTFDEVEWDVALEVLEVNAISPMMVTQAALPLLRRATNPCVAMVTSLMGSIGDCQSGKSYAYRASKTALNMFTAAARNELRNDGIRTILLHPGWVKTDMGGPNAPVLVQDSVAGMLEQIQALEMEDSGQFVEYTGQVLPW